MAHVPNLILQPLVENAIKHGIEPHSRPGLIQISAQRRDQTLLLEIRDNGQGFPSGDVPGSGMGISIMEQYAEQAGIDLHIDSRPGHGTVVKALCRLAHEVSAG